MPDNLFEFVVEGPPVPLRAAKKNAKRYQQWKRQVRSAAEKLWPVGINPTANLRVSVTITNYYTLAPPDIDNIIKPILDAMNGLVYHDDQQVYTITSKKHDLAESVTDPRPIVAAGLGVCSELVYVAVEW